MATSTVGSKKPKERKAKIPLDFLGQKINESETVSINDPLVYYGLLDVTDEGTIVHQGRSIRVTVKTKESTSKIGFMSTHLESHKSLSIMNLQKVDNPLVKTLDDISALGSGHFGNVMLAEVKDGSDTIRMAVKRLNFLPSRNDPNRYSTLTDLKTIRAVGSGENPHVTKYFTAFVDNDKKQLLICMEVCETSMEKFYQTMHRLGEIQYLDFVLRRMISHIVDALKFLKSKSILHRDVKPSNILINQNPVIFKLCDFGICSPLVDSVSPTNTKGTQIYLAPERIDGSLSPKGYGIRSDMWALGLSTMEIINNQHPFDKKDPVIISCMVKTWIPVMPTYLSIELQQLVMWLLKEHHEERPENYDMILESPAVRLLPTDVTQNEIEMIRTVISSIPPASENP